MICRSPPRRGSPGRSDFSVRLALMRMTLSASPRRRLTWTSTPRDVVPWWTSCDASLASCEEMRAAWASKNSAPKMCSSSSGSATR